MTAYSRRTQRPGFTLIELMIVVAIIGILAAVAVPKFADLLRKSQEGATKGSLGALRSALSIYYSDMEGWYPSGSFSSNSTVLSATLVPKYINKIPKVKVPDYHAATSNVFNHQTIRYHGHDGYGWIFDGRNIYDSEWGTLWVSCSHTDTKGTGWTFY